MTFRRLITAALAALMSLAMVFGASLSASATQVIVATISAGSSPQFTVLSPDGTKLYAATTNSKQLSIINTATNQVETTYSLPSSISTVVYVDISPDGRKLYISDQKSSSVSSKLIVLDVSSSTPSVITQVTIGKISNGIAVSPDGSRIYVTNSGDNTISVVNSSDYSVVTIPTVPSSVSGEVMDYPLQPALSPDGTSLYVTYYKDTSGATTGVAGIVKFDTANNQVLSKTEFGNATTGTANPYGLTVSADGLSVYVASYRSSVGGWVKKFDSALSNPVDVDTSSSAYNSAIIRLSADNSLLYVAKTTGSVNIYKTSDFSRTNIALTGSPVGSSISPSANTSSHFAYVGTTGSVFLIGEYLSANWQTLSGNTGTTLTSTALTASGISGTVTYSVAPALPVGFTLNTSTGVVSGSSSTPLSATTYTITGTDGTTSAVATVSITVTDPSTPSGGGSSSQLANTGKKSQLPIALIGLMFLFAGISVYSGSVALKRKAD